MGLFLPFISVVFGMYYGCILLLFSYPTWVFNRPFLFAEKFVKLTSNIILWYFNELFKGFSLLLSRRLMIFGPRVALLKAISNDRAIWRIFFVIFFLYFIDDFFWYIYSYTIRYTVQHTTEDDFEYLHITNMKRVKRWSQTDNGYKDV